MIQVFCDACGKQIVATDNATPLPAAVEVMIVSVRCSVTDRGISQIERDQSRADIGYGSAIVHHECESAACERMRQAVRG